MFKLNGIQEEARTNAMIALLECLMYQFTVVALPFTGADRIVLAQSVVSPVSLTAQLAQLAQLFCVAQATGSTWDQPWINNSLGSTYGINHTITESIVSLHATQPEGVILCKYLLN